MEPCGGDGRRDQSQLDAVVAEAAAEGITLSVTATDLSGRYCDATLTAGDDERVKAASIIKLALLATLMDRVDRNELDLDTTIHIPAGSSNIVGGSGTLRNRTFPLAISIDELMHLMVQVSNNIATNVLIDVAGGFDTVNAYTAAHGFSDLWRGRKMIYPAEPPLHENYITSSEVTELHHGPVGGLDPLEVVERLHHRPHARPARQHKVRGGDPPRSPRQQNRRTRRRLA